MAVFRERASSAEGAGAEAAADVDVLYKVEGRGTALLAEASAGELVRIVGPLGNPFPLPRAGDRSVVIGGGTGIASIFGLVAESPADARQTVILGARAESDLMARPDFEALGVDLRFTTEDGSLGEKGLVTGPLERLLGEGDVSTVYCCGPTPMMRACAELSALAGVTCFVSLENNMACGFGVCLGCAAPRPAGDYALVCRDGPVFDAAEIQWDGLP
jgi:dihydroorotate dehydrogenase electron transfer subunit